MLIPEPIVSDASRLNGETKFDDRDAWVRGSVPTIP